MQAHIPYVWGCNTLAYASSACFLGFFLNSVCTFHTFNLMFRSNLWLEIKREGKMQHNRMFFLHTWRQMCELDLTFHTFQIKAFGPLLFRGFRKNVYPDFSRLHFSTKYFLLNLGYWTFKFFSFMWILLLGYENKIYNWSSVE